MRLLDYIASDYVLENVDGVCVRDSRPLAVMPDGTRVCAPVRTVVFNRYFPTWGKSIHRRQTVRGRSINRWLKNLPFGAVVYIPFDASGICSGVWISKKYANGFADLVFDKNGHIEMVG